MKRFDHKRMPRSGLTHGLGVMLVSALLTGCDAHGEAESASAPPPPEVDVATVLVAPVTLRETFTGRVASPQTVQVRPRVSGYIDEVAFEEGELVEAGDLLFRIDPRPYEARVQAAKASLAQAQSQRRLANVEAERSRQLIQKHMISQEQHDQRQAAALAARARQAEAEAALTSAELDLQYTRVTAPVAGRTGRAMVTQGNLASADASVLTTLVSVDPLYVYFDSNEADAQGAQTLLARNEPLTLNIGLTGETGFPHQGRLDFVDNQINADTGTLRYRAVLPNPDGLFRPGQFARVEMPVANLSEAMLINRKAVLANQDRRVVYVVGDDDTVTPRQVQLGREVGDLVVVRDGLKAGERVIVNGTQKILAPGMPVTPNPIAMREAGVGNDVAVNRP
ncbi:multidrug efflux system membrane fusion protein [Chromohalobacter marismortui]|uniref:Multidrug efflux system membrane fusion protein n=1 Tax=Chromohalobacter marismortui TaxID=42055 RepID=A0A4R7NN48_9GAMM|nr:MULTISPECIES: efflux RND transporter periplasmic adaptor subunit [Chromohalobacter]MCI0509554.1 efflux RND transporter periplasmic adaptor subunit [Chromohalobacter sp.]MCI0592552.1 efflux RND transporter periplasmic adaptor subunit [Chromohalobacter sp.]TDU22274.1 multidrug efflux system membrane fusion protein [Chromohalobacter marismortui]